MENGSVTVENRSKDKVDRMIDYINGQYDDTFEFLDEYGGKPFGITHSIHVISKNVPGKLISVFCDTVDGEERFYDNYLDVKYEDRTREFLTEVLKKEFGDKVFVAFSPSNNPKKGGDQSFEDYIADDKPIRLVFTAIIKSEMTDKDRFEKKIEKVFKDNNISCIGKIYFETDFDDLDKLTLDNYSSEYLILDTYDASIYFSSSVNEGMDNINWEIKHE